MMMGMLRPGLHGYLELGDPHAEDLGRELLGADAVVHLVGVPFLEAADELDLLLVPDRADAEEVGDVDDAQAADLHVVADHLVGALAHEDRAVDAADVHDVVGDEPVARAR